VSDFFQAVNVCLVKAVIHLVCDFLPLLVARSYMQEALISD